MSTKTRKKPKLAVRGTPFGPDNPPPKSPGRPPTVNVGDLVAKEQELQPGISERLASVRAAVKWNSKAKCPHPSVRFYVELKGKNARDFSATWERLEKEFEAGQLGVVAAVSVGTEEQVIRATETDEELREAIVELLRKHGESL